MNFFSFKENNVIQLIFREIESRNTFLIVLIVFYVLLVNILINIYYCRKKTELQLET